MKQFNLWFILALIAVLAMTCASQLQPNDHTYTVQTDTIPDQSLPRNLGDTIKLEDILLYTDRDGVMYFDTNKTKHLHGFTGDSIVHYYGYLFDVGERNELKKGRVSTVNYKIAGEITKYRYDLYHKNYLYKRTSAYFEEQSGLITMAKFRRYDLNIDTTMVITESEAKKKAINDMPENIKVWQVKVNKKIKKVDEVDKLMYAVSIWSFAPMNHQEVLIDPKNGKICGNYSLHKKL